MKEVWKELMSGVCVKTLFITLLSITTFLSCALYFFYSSKGFAPERDKIKKSAGMVVPDYKAKSTQTNFTQ